MVNGCDRQSEGRGFETFAALNFLIWPNPPVSTCVCVCRHLCACLMHAKFSKVCQDDAILRQHRDWPVAVNGHLGSGGANLACTVASYH